VSLYGQALAGAELWTNAAKVASEAVKLDPNNIENWRALARSTVETRDYKTALDAYDRILKKNAMKGEDTIKLASAYFNDKQEDKSLSLYLAALRKDSTNCDPYYNLGFIYMKKQNWAEAARMFEKKIGCDPRSLNAYLNAGMSYMQPPENLPRARELFVKAIELKPDYLQSKLWLARYYAKVDSTGKMREVYDDVIKLANDDPAKNKAVLGEAYAQMGSTAMQAKNYVSALEYFRKALAINESAGLNLAVGQCIILTLGENGEVNRPRIEEAAAKFRRTIAAEPNNAQGHYWLGDALVRLRDPADPAKSKQLATEACAEFSKAIKLDPKNKAAREAMERIGCK
jgi:tetratricopeptide (TPR) repeat protein